MSSTSVANALPGPSDLTKIETKDIDIDTDTALGRDDVTTINPISLLYNRTIKSGHTVLFRLPSGDTRSLVIKADQ